MLGWHGVAVWKWEVNDECCGICRSVSFAQPIAQAAVGYHPLSAPEKSLQAAPRRHPHSQAFEACCPDCKTPGDGCPPMWGKCNHAFHIHCIMKWLEKNNTCPMCRAEWQYKEGDR